MNKSISAVLDPPSFSSILEYYMRKIYIDLPWWGLELIPLQYITLCYVQIE